MLREKVRLGVLALSYTNNGRSWASSQCIIRITPLWHFQPWLWVLCKVLDQIQSMLLPYILCCSHFKLIFYHHGQWMIGLLYVGYSSWPSCLPPISSNLSHLGHDVIWSPNFLIILSSQTVDQVSSSESQVHNLCALCQNKAHRLWHALGISCTTGFTALPDIGSSLSLTTKYETLGSTTARAPSIVPTYIANWSMRRRELLCIMFLSRITCMDFIRKHSGRVC